MQEVKISLGLPLRASLEAEGWLAEGTHAVLDVSQGCPEHSALCCMTPSELIVLHVSGGGGGDPLVHLLLFADFLCVAGAGAIENWFIVIHTQ